MCGPQTPGRFQVLPCMRAAYVLDPRIVSLTRDLASGAARAPPGWGPEDLLEECKPTAAQWIKGQYAEDAQADFERALSDLDDYLLCQGRPRHRQIECSRGRLRAGPLVPQESSDPSAATLSF